MNQWILVKAGSKTMCFCFIYTQNICKQVMAPAYSSSGNELLQSICCSRNHFYRAKSEHIWSWSIASRFVYIGRKNPCRMTKKNNWSANFLDLIKVVSTC